MPYDFDTIINRKGTNSLKFDFAAERGYPTDVLPLWVADMDFPAPPVVNEALHVAVNHGIYGYSETKRDYASVVSDWFENNHFYRPDEDWLVKTPGVVFALATAVKALTKEGDSVLIQPPVYYPFYEVIRDNDRKIVENPLKEKDGHYEIDFEDFEKKIEQENVKLFILCSPHNPVGRVWKEWELVKIAEICLKHEVYVVSDEIHCDLLIGDNRHIPFLKIAGELAQKTIVCTSPSKSFNIAGLQVANNFIPDLALRRRFRKEIDKAGYSQHNTLGLVAARAAYEKGAEWLNECRKYLAGNLELIRSFVKEKLPGVRLIEPEATYFAWLDFNGLGLDVQELDRLIINKAKLWLDSGKIFGESGRGFERIAYATQRARLEEALKRLTLILN